MRFEVLKVRISYEAVASRLAAANQTCANLRSNAAALEEKCTYSSKS